MGHQMHGRSSSRKSINVTKMKGNEMRVILYNMHDFKYEKARIEKLLMDHSLIASLF